MSLVKFRLLAMSLTYQNSFSTAYKYWELPFLLKNVSVIISLISGDIPYLTKVVQTVVKKKRVDLVMTLRTMLGE